MFDLMHLKKNWILLSVIALLIIITFSTAYYGSTDITDYSDIAKYFAGDFPAKIRSSHSYLYGALHYPLIALFPTFIVFKITSVIFLLLLVYSVYLVSGKNRKALWLMLLSPLVWYMAPWINPIQLSALLFFWAYYFMKKYSESSELRFLFFSGILAGLSWAFWDAMLFFIIIFSFSFLFNKKFYYCLIFTIFLLLGLLPKLLFDQIYMGFAFIGIIRYFFGLVASTFYGRIYGDIDSAGFSLLPVIIILIFIPFFIYKLYSRENWQYNKKSLIFITLSVLLILKIPQIRYLLLLTPIIIFDLAPMLNSFQFKKQIIIFSIITILTITPYIIQIKYSTNAEEFTSLLMNFDKIKIYESQNKLMVSDLKAIAEEFPDSVFVVGNEPDDFQTLAHLYWGKNIKELASIQDYNLYYNNQTSLFEKKFMPVPKIKDRRQIWLAGGLSKNENDDTDYSSINLAIGIGQPIKLEGFSVIKKYNLLYLSSR